MSCKLWQYFLQDDVEAFKSFLANANYTPGQRSTAVGPKLGSYSASLGSPPGTGSKTKRLAASPLQEKALPVQGPPVIISRTDANSRDRHGRTLLHLACSSQKESALEFVRALFAIPFLDIYAQDVESGWTALHRALYAGNIAIAQALIARDITDATGFRASNGCHHASGGLIKIKDREGNSPFELFGTTIVARDINKSDGDPMHTTDDDSSECSSVHDETEVHTSVGKLRPLVNFAGSEVFTFGSNKNLSLGQGDGDDRQFPERVSLTRPDHLLYRFYHERESLREEQGLKNTDERREFDSASELPIKIRSQSIIYQDIVMAKLHTAILTTDPESNLYMCGFGSGGRLGTGDESTRFHFTCIEGGAIAGKKIISVALGQDHSIAISEQGEVFTWGSNKHGQLGYALPKTNQKDDLPVQTTPRQIFNPFKKEMIVAAAASAIHSVVYTTTSIYTFGKNEGQLGLIDADARSLEVLVIPRRVGASLFNQSIIMATAIDRATAVLLENHDVWVFTHYGYSRLSFPLDGSSSFIRDSFLSTRYGLAANFVVKITSGGNTICAMSSFGEVYTINVSRKADTHSVSSSTTNPSKIRNSLPQPSRVWSIRKSHMAVRDVDVGHDGSIIICTESGSAWRKEPRNRLKDAGGNLAGERQTKDYKFVRIPGLSRVVAVRSNAFGAYAAAQRECEVTNQIVPRDRTIWHDLSSLLPFKDLLDTHVLEDISRNHRSEHQVSPGNKTPLRPLELEASLDNMIKHCQPDETIPALVWVSSTSSKTRIPVHEFVLSARSSTLRKAFFEFRQSYYYSIPDLLSIEYNSSGQAHLQFHNFDFLSIFNIVLFVYTDKSYNVWNRIRQETKHASRYRQVRTEVIKLATQLDLKYLERAARLMIQPEQVLNLDMENTISHPSFFDSGDVIIELDRGNVKAHSPILCQRCPFFDALFNGRAGGRWLSSRREEGTGTVEMIRIDLKHITPEIFAFVLRHIYADTDDELFEDVQTTDLNDFIELIIDVMFVANELMIDRLAEICQKLLGSFVDIRNVVPFLNTVAPCSVTAFKRAALEYICLNSEVMLENRLLDNLDSDLFEELDDICRQNQIAHYPISKARNTQEYILEKYPELVSRLEQDRQRQIDSMKLRSRLHEDEVWEEKLKVGSLEKPGIFSPPKSKTTTQEQNSKLPIESPLLKSKPSNGDLIFPMDDECTLPASLVSSTPRTFKAQADISNWRYPGEVSPPSKYSPSLGPISGINIVPNFQRSPTLPPSSSPIISGVGGTPGAPWGLSGRTPKAGLKDIMAETSGLKGQQPQSISSIRRELEVPKPTPSKLSQRERKKMKQQQLQGIFSEVETPKAKPISPWQTPSVPNNTLGVDKQQNNQSPSAPKQSSSKASLNLRQTVSGSPCPSQNAEPEPSTGTKSTLAPKFFNSTPLSLADILQQQQFEKDVIRETATAKHNLHDIQVEQEFQEWWDAESKRVMEEEAAVSTTTSASGCPRGHGRKREAGRGGQGKNRGRGGAQRRDIQKNAENSANQASAPVETVPRSGLLLNGRFPAQHQQRNADDRKNNDRARGSFVRGGSNRGSTHGKVRISPPRQ
ncbi:hypothetical protein LOZ66_001566 [Ophidiomyces ophidiicola]|nr:hypothetical protein LOZ66_001566 [Ophidiomyces ophidiicola]